MPMIPIPQRTQPILVEPKLDRFRMLVAQSVLFRGCSVAALDDILRRLQVRTAQRGQRLVVQGDAGDSIYIVALGRARVTMAGESGREVVLATLRSGDFFGELSLFDGRPRTASVTASEEVTALVLSRESFLAHLKLHPQTALNIAAELSRRLRRADQTIFELALEDVESRLVRTLERLAKEDGELTVDGLVLRRRPTQQELANMVGSCRETVSRTFSSMIRRGLIVPRGKSVTLTRQLLEKGL
jgi:CRP-like cAMP-binding protein